MGGMYVTLVGIELSGIIMHSFPTGAYDWNRHNNSK